MLNVARGVKLVDDVYGTGLLLSRPAHVSPSGPTHVSSRLFFLFSAVFRWFKQKELGFLARGSILFAFFSFQFWFMLKFVKVILKRSGNIAKWYCPYVGSWNSPQIKWSRNYEWQCQKGSVWSPVYHYVLINNGFLSLPAWSNNMPHVIFRPAPTWRSHVT